jgi:membrane protease YdiL (CAAX protease family)
MALSGLRRRVSGLFLLAAASASILVAILVSWVGNLPASEGWTWTVQQEHTSSLFVADFYSTQMQRGHLWVGRSSVLVRHKVTTVTVNVFGTLARVPRDPILVAGFDRVDESVTFGPAQVQIDGVIIPCWFLVVLASILPVLWIGRASGYDRCISWWFRDWKVGPPLYSQRSAARARMRQPRYPVLWFFVFTYVLTGVGQGVNLYVMHRLSAATAAGTPIEDSPLWAWRTYGFYVTNAGPSLVGLLMTLCLYGLPGVRRLAVQLAPWSVGRAWPVLAVCLFLPLLCIVLPFTILDAFGGSDPPDSWSLSTYVYGAIISGGFIGPGLCEEIGWRGFALPLLQRRYSALVSSLIIGVAWALWHWPNYFIAAIHAYPFWAFAAAIPMGMAASILYTWVFNSTGGSLFAVVVLHGATVSTPSIPASAGSAAVIIPLLYVIIAIGLVWRYGAMNLSWRERVVAEPPNQSLHTDGGRITVFQR